MTLHLAMVLRIAAIASVGALGTFGFWRTRPRLRFPYSMQPLSDADYDALCAKPGWRAHRLSVGHGVALRGLLREPKTAAGPWVLFFSGNSSVMLGESQKVLDALCADQGWGGVVWAYRGFDSSDGAPRPAALEGDGFKAFAALLAERKIRPNAVHLVGFSLGTGIAAAVAARACREPPASLTLLAPMTELYVGARTQLRLHHYETTKWLGSIASPVLVIHGARDTALSVEHGRAVAETLGSRARLLVLPEIGHDELPMTPAALDAMRAFVSRHVPRQ